jgi:DNA-binding GntR family transcriptional regulator
VAEISLDDFEELYRARQMIECYAIDLISEKHTRVLPELESTVAATSGLTPPSESDPQHRHAYLEANTAFHLKLVEASGNRHMLRFYETITSNLGRYQFIYFFSSTARNDAQEDHREVLECLRTENYAKARELVKSHIENYASLMRSLMFREENNVTQETT